MRAEREEGRDDKEERIKGRLGNEIFFFSFLSGFEKFSLIDKGSLELASEIFCSRAAIIQA